MRLDNVRPVAYRFGLKLKPGAGGVKFPVGCEGDEARGLYE